MANSNVISRLPPKTCVSELPNLMWRYDGTLHKHRERITVPVTFILGHWCYSTVQSTQPMMMMFAVDSTNDKMYWYGFLLMFVLCRSRTLVPKVRSVGGWPIIIIHAAHYSVFIRPSSCWVTFLLTTVTVILYEVKFWKDQYWYEIILPSSI